jgi:hypothetical protein
MAHLTAPVSANHHVILQCHQSLLWFGMRYEAALRTSQVAEQGALNLFLGDKQCQLAGQTRYRPKVGAATTAGGSDSMYLQDTINSIEVVLIPLPAKHRWAYLNRFYR